MSKGHFKSENFIFRPTSLGMALVKAGLAKEADFLLREAKREGTLRQRNDDMNLRPSKHVVLDYTPEQKKTA